MSDKEIFVLTSTIITAIAALFAFHLILGEPISITGSGGQRLLGVVIVVSIFLKLKVLSEVTR